MWINWEAAHRDPVALFSLKNYGFCSDMLFCGSAPESCLSEPTLALLSGFSSIQSPTAYSTAEMAPSSTAAMAPSSTAAMAPFHPSTAAQTADSPIFSSSLSISSPNFVSFFPISLSFSSPLSSPRSQISTYSTIPYTN